MKILVAMVRWRMIYCNEKWEYLIDIYDKQYKAKSIESLIDKVNKDIRKRQIEDDEERMRKEEYFWEHYWQYYD